MPSLAFITLDDFVYSKMSLFSGKPSHSQPEVKPAYDLRLIRAEPTALMKWADSVDKKSSQNDFVFMKNDKENKITYDEKRNSLPQRKGNSCMTPANGN